VTLRLRGLSAQVPTDGAGRAVVGVVRPQDDGLRLVFADGAVVYQRLHALPRIRLATTAVVQPDKDKQLPQLRAGLPPSSVLLSASAGAGGGDGQLEVQQDDAERLRVRTTTTGETWLVVADAMQHGWVAEVDGRRVPLVRADYSGVAVALPSGEHRVTLRYTAPGLGAGRLISLVAALLLAFGAWSGRYAGSRPGSPSDTR
jgi:hypothetical protein